MVLDQRCEALDTTRQFPESDLHVELIDQRAHDVRPNVLDAKNIGVTRESLALRSGDARATRASVQSC